jgi:glyoxylase-like metal-dependent hydrolase (beta-lactamase superfamily II)
MIVTDAGTGTNLAEIADGIFRINTPIPPSVMPGGFSFNQYLIRDEEPLLFHTGPRALLTQVRTAIAAAMPIERLRYVSFSHFEADECGTLNQLLALAPQAQPLCGRIAALVSIGDLADRPPVAMNDGETRSLGRHRVRWLDAPHLPHGWDCGYLFEEATATLLCGDLLTQPGPGAEPLTRGDILSPSDAFRRQMDYFAHSPQTPGLIAKLAATKPRRLACMHGSAWEGDGTALLGALGQSLAA